MTTDELVPVKEFAAFRAKIETSEQQLYDELLEAQEGLSDSPDYTWTRLDVCVGRFLDRHTNHNLAVLFARLANQRRLAHGEFAVNILES